jgi:hypothetical protein
MRVLFSAGVVASALALAGCGGGRGGQASTTTAPATTTAPTTSNAVLPTLTTAEAQRYDQAMLSLGTKLGKAVDGLYPLDTGTPGSAEEKQAIAKLVRAHIVVSSVEKSLGRIQPPSAVAAEHRALRKDAHAVARQIAELATSLRTGDTDTFSALSQLPALARVTAETDAIRKKGYDVLTPNG